MSLDEVIRDSPQPQGVESLTRELRALGIVAGATVIAHVSLSSLGYVVGGAAAVLEALLRALGPAGTLVMPAQTPLLTDPSEWRFPAVPPDWVSRIRWETPAYDPARTPTSGIGVVAELFRTWPGVMRSAHPVCSFTAVGPAAAAILEPHPLDDPFGTASPLARLYRMAGAHILLLGAPWTACTAFHLAERHAEPMAAPLPNWSPLIVDGERRLVSWLEYPHDTAPFPLVGQVLETERPTILGAVGLARCRYVSLRAAIDVATRELKNLAAG